MDWFSIQLKSDNEAVKDFVTTCAFDLGATGVEDLKESYFLDDQSERGRGLKIYFSADKEPQEIINSLKEYLQDFEGSDIDWSEQIVIDQIAKTNWREEWKKEYKPIDAWEFMVVPSWLDDDFPNKIKILIEPKMAFGTGTHETTRMMLNLISDISFKGTKVLDAGTGSGILAIATAKKGAKEISGVDVEIESVQNSQENWALNNLDPDLVNFSLVDESTYHNENYFDVVLANIHRTVLEVLISDLAKVCKNGGTILLSGILIEEKELMLKSINNQAGLQLEQVIELNEWCSLKLTKKVE